MDLYEINKRLIGNIMPIGESDKDAISLINLSSHSELVIKLVVDLIDISKLDYDQRNSVRQAGINANNCLDVIQDLLDSIK